MGIEVTVVNDAGLTGWASGATHLGELDLRNVTQMVDTVIHHMRTYVPPPSATDVVASAMSEGGIPLPPPPIPGSLRISRLNVDDHGSPSGGYFGSDWVDVVSFARFSTQFRRLAPWFEPGGFAHLQHCQIGQNTALLQMFADVWGVPVVGGRGYSNPVYRFNWGDYVRVYPATGGTRRAPDVMASRP